MVEKYAALKLIESYIGYGFLIAVVVALAIWYFSIAWIDKMLDTKEKRKQKRRKKK